MNRKLIGGVEHKKCGECQTWRPLSDFYKRKSVDGYRKECRFCFLGDCRDRYTRDRVIIQKRNKVYHEAHKNEINQYKSQWQKDNKEKRRIRLNERYQNEPNFRIAVNLRSRVLKAIENNQKAGSTLELLGCSVDFFKLYLESKFTPEMSWGNHGSVWHIDHIKPCAKFDLSKPEEQRVCFHYKNMQPLFAYENMSKKDKYENSPSYA